MKKKIDFEAITDKIITKDEVIQIAKETMFFQRAGGKISPSDFLFTLMFKASASIPLSLGHMSIFLNNMVSRPGLHKRYNKLAVFFAQKVLQKIIFKRVSVDNKLSINGLNEFSNVFIIDSSSWDISENLKWIFPGSGGSASDANCKLQFAYDYLTGDIYIYDDKPGNSPDQKYSINLLKILTPGSLFLFDLGYWKFETFYGIELNNAYFLSRLSNKVNLYVKIDQEYKKISIEDVFDNLEHENISVDEIYLKKGDKYLKVRLIGLKLPTEKANLNRSQLYSNAKKRGSTPKRKSLILAGYSIYVTNAPENIIKDNMVRTYYRLRWNVELIFKSFKSVLKIHETNVISNENRLKCELYARLILVAIVHKMHFVIDNFMWSTSKKELSLDKFWKYIDSEKGLLYTLMKSGSQYFVNHIKRMQERIMLACEKLHQKSRKTTREMIDNQIGEPIPFKIDSISLCEIRRIS